MMTIDSIHCSRLLPCLALVLMPLGCNQPTPPESDDADGGETMGAMDSLDSADSSMPGSDGDGGDSAGSDGGGTGDGDGDGEAGDGDGDGDGDMAELDLFPLVDGAQWTYVRKNSGDQILGMETVTAHEITWEDMQAWEMIDEPDGQGKWNKSVLVRDGDLVLRVHREEMEQIGIAAIIDYDPGFLRVSEAWTKVGPPQEFLYDRIAYDGNGNNPEVEERGHTFEVLAVDEQVTVPAGTFDDCVKFERVRTKGAESGALTWFWYAPGVGKVREENPIEMEIEELVSVSIPGGVELP